jgi:hypothetical protein
MSRRGALIVALAALALGSGFGPASPPAEPEVGSACRPEPASALTVDPGAGFWATHPAEAVTVPFRFHVARDGSVGEVRLLPGDYGADYGSETVRAVRGWSFRPFSCAPDGLWVETYARFVNSRPGSARASGAAPRGRAV